VNLFDSLDDFQTSTQFFAENFLSQAEQIAPIQSAVVKEFQRLGVTGVNTKDQFKQLVLGLDLTTAAGQEMYAALLKVAPAFAKVFDYLNPDAANAAADGWRSVFQNMQDWIRQLNGEITGSVQSTSQAYAAFQAAAIAARGGDAAAAAQVLGLGKAYLDSAKASANSEFDYLQAVAKARAIASSVQLAAGAAAGITTGAGSTTPFSPATSPTGSTAPGYTYTPPVTVVTPPVTTPTTAPGVPDPVTGLTPEQLAAIKLYTGGGLYNGFRMLSFDTGGSFGVGGTGPKDFGPVTLHGQEVVNVSRRDTMEAVVTELRALKAEMASLQADNRVGFTKLASNTARVAKVVEDWDGAGLPPDRTAEEAA
jgi:hypothetical protein